MSSITKQPGAICLPALEFMPTLAALSLVALMLSAPKGTVLLSNTTGCTIARKRNRLVRDFLEDRALQWLLFVDSDMASPPDTISRLLTWGVDVVSALYFTKLPPWIACAQENVLTDKTLTEFGGPRPLKRVEAIGTGCLMVRRRVFEHMASPWFEADAEGCEEDGNFSKKLREAGVPIHCDTSLVAGHLTTLPVDVNHVIGWDYMRAHEALSRDRR